MLLAYNKDVYSVLNKISPKTKSVLSSAGQIFLWLKDMHDFLVIKELSAKSKSNWKQIIC